MKHDDVVSDNMDETTWESTWESVSLVNATAKLPMKVSMLHYHHWSSNEVTCDDCSEVAEDYYDDEKQKKNDAD